MRRRFERLGELDLVDRLSGALPPLAIQIIFGVACAGLAIGARLLVDIVAMAAGPYALLYPAVLIATLFGRATAGVSAFAVSFLYAWYVVLPEHNSFHFSNPGDLPRTLVNAASALIIVMLADLFRAAVRRAVIEREQEINARDLLLREIDHRTKNNFAIVSSLLDLQRRQETDEAARAALSIAASRVQSFSGAHCSLYNDLADLSAVDMREYLKTLTDHLGEALFLSGRVDLHLKADAMALPRDRAVSIGLVLNEVVTNAAKHAFGEGETGAIDIVFAKTEKGWRLEVADDGRGMNGASGASGGGGLGARLIAAFAQKAGATMHVEKPEKGSRVVLESDGEAV